MMSILTIFQVFQSLQLLTNIDNNNQIKNKNVLITTQTEISTFAVLCSADQKIVHDKRKSFYHQQETNIVTNDKGPKDKNKTNTIVSPEFVLKHE